MLHLAYKDRRTLWSAKVLIFFDIGYTLSPIDLIPDFFPIDTYFAVSLIPKGVKTECLLIVKGYKWNKKK
ncbi:MULTISPECIES: YkvA family protein [Flavobacteriaceae]|uniref:Uncharacterized protein n=1 Tax=Maribacter cobaltidurans TaxID=1178778 RepID=A0A223V9G7_9FLAO|nr:hypothetical protein CJ263_16020 [Maribacter cobaltidurans]GGD96138.1 hypothetical protein GCM10011412_37830 [Maribacter cobaltidurans]